MKTSNTKTRQFPIVLQSPSKNGFTFFRRIHADGRVERKNLGQAWEPNDTPTIQMDRLEKYLFTMTERIGWTIQPVTVGSAVSL